MFHSHGYAFFLLLIEEEIALFGLISCEGEDEGKGFFSGYFYTEGAGIGGNEAGLPAKDNDGDAWQRMFIFIQYFA